MSVSDSADTPTDWPNNTTDTLPPHLKEGLDNVDVVIFGHASTTPGFRTGDLITAKAQLTLQLYNLHTNKRIQTLEVTSKDLDTSVESAARSALRRVAQDSLESLLPPLLEAIP